MKRSGMPTEGWENQYSGSHDEERKCLNKLTMFDILGLWPASKKTVILELVWFWIKLDTHRFKMHQSHPSYSLVLFASTPTGLHEANLSVAMATWINRLHKWTNQPAGWTPAWVMCVAVCIHVRVRACVRSCVLIDRWRGRGRRRNWIGESFSEMWAT